MGAKKTEGFLGISNSTSRSVCFKEVRERMIGQDTLHPLLASVAQSQVHTLAHTNVYTPQTQTHMHAYTKKIEKQKPEATENSFLL